MEGFKNVPVQIKEGFAVETAQWYTNNGYPLFWHDVLGVLLTSESFDFTLRVCEKAKTEEISIQSAHDQLYGEE